ncbi:MAG: hypothetical protein LQ346_005494 [Caloplaca aetnensis]|nr:MAG: hypothetical protein LQ346_005494 [Caloplaca aetnensis]
MDGEPQRPTQDESTVMDSAANTSRHREGLGVASSSEELEFVDFAAIISTPRSRRRSAAAPSPKSGTPNGIRRGGVNRPLSAYSQKVWEGMKQQAQEAGLVVASGDEDDGAASQKPSHSFTKKALGEEQRMRRISEESRSSLSYTLSHRSRNFMRELGISWSVWKKQPSFYNIARVNATIAGYDAYLENPESYHDCFRQRLKHIRGIFDDFRSRGLPKDLGELWHLQQLDREVKVSQEAQKNIKEFTYLLVDVAVAESIKRSLRKSLYYAEDAARPSPERNSRKALEELQSHANEVEHMLVAMPARRLCLVVSEADKAQTKKDAENVLYYVQRLLQLRYEHPKWEDDYNNLIDCSRVRPLATYLKWKATGDRAVKLRLAKSQDLHLVEVDYLFQPRMDRLLDEMVVDAEYIKARLLDLDNIWGWVSGYNLMAHSAEWAKLAGQLHDDQKQLNNIFPGPVVYPNPEMKIPTFNTKGRVHFGMIQIRGYYFAKIVDADSYILSKTGRRIDQNFHKREKLRRKEQNREERSRPSTLTRVRDWVRRKRAVIRFRRRHYHQD